MIFEQVIYHNSIKRWFLAVVLTAVVYVLTRFLKGILQRRIGKIASETTTNWDDLAFELIDCVHTAVLLVFGIYIGSLVLSFPEGENIFGHGGIFCASVGKLTEKMIAAYIEQHEKAPPKDVFTVSDDPSASAETTDFQS